MHYLPADFFLLRGSSLFFSTAIAEGTKEEGADLTFSHALVSIGEGKNPDVIEAVIPRVRKVKLQVALHDALYAVCLRPLALTGMQRARIVLEACRHEEELYGFDGYVARCFGALLNSDAIEAFRLSPRFPDCSELAGLCLQSAGISVGEAPSGLTPNEFYVWAKTHPDQWQIFGVG